MSCDPTPSSLAALARIHDRVSAEDVADSMVDHLVRGTRQGLHLAAALIDEREA